MLRTRFNFTLIITFLALMILVLIIQMSAGTAAAGDEGIRPLIQTEQPMSDAQRQAQDLALLDARVEEYTAGDRAEVFSVFPVSVKAFPAEFPQCADGSCYQVDIYNFDQNAAVIAMVHAKSGTVIDVFNIEGAHPQVNKRLYSLAQQIIHEDADVEAALGFQPELEQIRLMESNRLDTTCDGRNLCATAVFFVDNGTVWVMVNFNTEEIEKIWWTDRNLEPDYNDYSNHREPEDCGTTDSVNKDGWTLDYLTTPNDALNVTNVKFGGKDVVTSMKLLEWHAHYPGNWGYVDYTGCGGGSGGFPIYPYGDTQVNDMYDDTTYIGFEVVQDFRMSNWGNSCNYRYEQHFQFFTDGRWRVATAAFGQGCGNDTTQEATYRPVIRIDIAADGAADDSIAVWNGTSWDDQTTEAWWLQSGPYTTEGYRYRVLDQGGDGYYVEPGQGQFGDGGTGDNAYLYATLYKTSEGAIDMSSIGNCCTGNYQQGPEGYINSENISSKDIVLWYVPQSETITTWQVNQGQADAQYCWTDNTNNTWPCVSGPMFVPVDSCVAETAVAPTAAIAAAANGMDVELNWSDDAANGGGYEVWRGRTPYFDPNGITIGTVKVYEGFDTSFTDSGILGNTFFNYTYIIRAKDCSGTSTADSIRVGEFDHPVVMGTP
ncbi:MAG: hypothetical protein KDE48_18700 [Anaerolineales bacterium]|nr:hypothetical protein [Anaerolineales bacterium]